LTTPSNLLTFRSRLITFKATGKLLELLDDMVYFGKYSDRSELIRDALEDFLTGGF
jgi:Arc/MetJ-type ribon-helix-helix transcriptional regulator